MEPSAVGLPMMLFTVLGVLASIPVVVYALARRRFEPIRKLGMAAALWGGIYTILLLLASLTSTERTLAVGERLPFCGFYIDCHIGVRVDGAETVRSIEGPSGAVIAQQTFHIVHVTYDSDARSMPLRLRPEPIVVAIGRGFRFEPRSEATTAIRTTLGIESYPGRVLEPHGGQISSVYVFDAPASVKLRLLVTKGDDIDRIVELFLIGDEDSMLHEKTYLATE